MMIQTAPEGAPRFAIKMDEHTALAGQFAKAYGNASFEPVEPRDLMLYMINNHDKGWFEYDAAPGTDPKTGLPYNLVHTPPEDITKTSSKSPDFNEKRHPYCGLLSSMHSWGLYNGRYGLSDKVLINTIPPEQRHLAERMLEGELKRQEKLKAEIAKDPQAAAWLEEGHLFQNYKQLQFFDTLALYFNCTHEAARGEARFDHVPMSAKKDVTVTLKPVAPGVYAMSPFPFAEDPAEFSFAGRYLQPLAGGQKADWGATMKSAPMEKQSFRIVAG